MKDVFKQLFDVFSRRPKAEGTRRRKEITAAFRNRIFLLCRDTFQPGQFSDELVEFWRQIHRKLQYLHGAPVLAPDVTTRDEGQDAIAFLHSCSSDHFLDFVEYIFTTDIFWRFSDRAQSMVDAINHFFQVEELPYALTDYLQVHEVNGSVTTTRVGAYPKVILREHGLIHKEVMAPTLALLTDPKFSLANMEFLKALEDYRKGDLRDCVAKCGSAFESVLKIICEKKKWPYQQTDTASRLLNIVLSHTTLDSFFEQPLIIVATLRNRLSTAHGAGVQPKTVSPQVARFALNSTAAAILLLVEVTR